MSTIKELDAAVLERDVQEQGLIRGDMGTVVFVHDAGKAYEVEFLTGAGKTIAVLTLDAGDVRHIGKNEIPHARKLE
jgi:hypothetical protein